LIVSIIALVKGDILIVKTSLIGSVLSNLLLVLGMSFFFGGLRRREQFFNETATTTASSLLAFAVAGLITVTAFDHFNYESNLSLSAMSRGMALLLLVYGCYLFFQLKTQLYLARPSER
jgi:Ca2+:H+ antiporter